MTNTINNVPRDWFDRVHALLYKVAYENTPEGLEAECLGSFIPGILSAPSPADHVEDARAMVAKPSPAGVDGLEVVGHLLTKGNQLSRMPAGAADEPLCRLSDAQAIIDGLRGELGAAVEMLAQQGRRNTELRKLRDQLAGLLREAHDTYRAAIHWEDLRGTMKRIDAALAELPK